MSLFKGRVKQTAASARIGQEPVSGPPPRRGARTEPIPDPRGNIPGPPYKVPMPPRPGALLCPLHGKACEDTRCAWKVGDKCAMVVIANELYAGVELMQTPAKG